MGRLVSSGKIGWNMNKRRHKFAMDFNRKGFSEKISKIISAFEPRNHKLLLANSISYPVKLHIYTFSTARGDGVIGNAEGTSIITKNGCGRLGVTQTSENIAQHSAVSSCYK